MIEVKRTVSKVIATEQGLFHDGNVPSDYNGSQIPIEMCHAIVFSDEMGNFTTFTVYASPAMNNDRAVHPYDHSKMYDVVAPVSEDTGSDDQYKHRLPQSVKDRVNQHFGLVESDGKSKAAI